MKCQNLFFLVKIKKNISICRLLKNLPSMLSVKIKYNIDCVLLELAIKDYAIIPTILGQRDGLIATSTSKHVQKK